MFPLHQAYEAKEAVREYLNATFEFADPMVTEAFDRFIQDRQTGLFKGPYISLKLPFKKAGDDEVIPLDIKPDFPPYLHQLKSFGRLTTNNGNIPQPTLLTTGTGSGKTECFLYPVLDYCYKNKDRHGIKAVIMYPMNALATDQAKRIAEIIWKDQRLKGKITVGLFIGTHGKYDKSNKRKAKQFPSLMGENHVIEYKEEILNSPPDILLTNFKMLDYSLIRAEYQRLWNRNFKDGTLLKFLILDELHTYDGAKGTDVANLIRRLKLKLNLNDRIICPAGTSATIGKGEDSKALLSEFASKVFGEPIDESSVIEEERLTTNEFFGDLVLNEFLPDAGDISDTMLTEDDDSNSYIRKQLSLWKIDPDTTPTDLSEKLKNFKILKDILDITSKKICHMDELIRSLSVSNRQFAGLGMRRGGTNVDLQVELLKSFFVLICYSKISTGTKMFPFLYLQVQQWFKELSGIVRAAVKEPEFAWNYEQAENNTVSLPAYFCRECGHSGWVSHKTESQNSFQRDIKKIYQKYFQRDPNVYLISIVDNPMADEYAATEIIDSFLDVRDLSIEDSKKEKNFKFRAFRKVNQYSKSENVCPHCNSGNTISIIGQQVVTLASVAVSEILASPMDNNPEKNRKLLVFTNSVQDAAHQAGFFQARNYRFLLRTAINQVIKTKGELKLTELCREFINYWTNTIPENKNESIEAYLYKFFPPDYNGRLKIESFKKHGQYDEHFIAEFDNRICWEIVSEFGYNSQIGRTLEKTSTATVYFDPSQFESVYERFLEGWLDNNGLGLITKEDFLKFLNGFIYRLRTRGGIDHIFLNRFRTDRSNYFLITQRTNPQHKLIRNFGKYTRLPKLITTDITQWEVFDRTYARQNTSNWFHQYYRKCFQLADSNSNLVNEFYQNLVEYLERANLIDVKTGAGVKNCALRPDAIIVNNKTAVYVCDKCGHKIYLSEEAVDITNDMLCIQYNCSGKYHVASGHNNNYYRTIYNRGKAIRIFSSEHTGLLERQDRERIESSFKKRPKHNSYNLLVATSTLEMGIDIGDLNSALNTSMPPLPSNYLQRIGRAGRLSGNALILNFNSNDAHDLYFYASPDEMMEGNINTPGCFLEAYDILRRHFIAYCFDSWTAVDPEKNQIPFHLKYTNIFSAPYNSEKIFINRIIKFIRSNSARLFDSFASKYQSITIGDKVIEINPEPIEKLRKELEFELYRRIEDVFRSLKDKIVFLNNQQADIDSRMKKLPESDPEREDLKNELKNVRIYYSALRKTNTLEYLTNTGLLPNYAFPETGVTLNATIRNKIGTEVGAGYEIQNIQVVRPASLAIKEMAPDNMFYTQGYKLKISGAQVVDWNNEVQELRFCSNCDNIDYNHESNLNEGKCPKCNDQSWGSATNYHKFLKFQTMLSYSNSEEAALDDRDEEREKEISAISFHLDFKESKTKGAWILKDIPFGIEYLKDVQIREINTGRTDFYDRARQIKINGEDVSQTGYVVCKHCNKVHIPTPFNQKESDELKFHYRFCKNKDTKYQNRPDDNFEELYLLRQFNTEAFKVLLPVQHVDSEIKVQLFKAGIMLGLKKYYKGDPQHILITDYKEFDKNTGRDNHFLILYDTIPGGTGYLGKLFENHTFAELIELAYKEIKYCQCQLENRKGCYRCIYTYSNQYTREKLNRAEAEKVFESIYSSINEWKYNENGLTDSSNVERIEESELEEWFIVLLNNLSNKPPEFITSSEFNKITRDNIVEYELVLKNEHATIYYDIIPQFELDSTLGVSNVTVADFLIRRKDYKVGNISNENMISSFPGITVYLDGYSFHATSKKNRFYDDFIKRKSISRSSRFVPWTLTWDDLNLYEKSLGDQIQYLRNDAANNFIAANNLTDRSKILDSMNSFTRLLFFLMTPDIQQIKEGILLYSYLSQNSFFGKCIKEENIEEYLNSHGQKDHLVFQNGYKDWIIADKLAKSASLSINVCQKNLKKIKGLLIITKTSEEWDVESWKLFWRYYNILQFFDEFEFSVEDVINHPVSINGEVEATDTFETVKDNFDEKYHELVKNLSHKNINFNKDTTFTLEDQNGDILAEADLCLIDHKIVFSPYTDSCNKRFEEKGYYIQDIETFEIENLKVSHETVSL